MCSCAGGGVDGASIGDVADVGDVGDVGPWFAGACGEDRVGDDKLLFLSGVGVVPASRAVAAMCLREP